jgi:hypothetical protein
MATLFNLKPFRFNLTDLNFMLDQIKFRPLFDAAGNAIINWDGTTPIYDSNVTATRVQLWDGNFAPPTVASGIHSAAEAIDAFGTSYASVTASQGLRDVTGLNNNLLLANHLWGSVDQPFSRSVPRTSPATCSQSRRLTRPRSIARAWDIRRPQQQRPCYSAQPQRVRMRYQVMSLTTPRA